MAAARALRVREVECMLSNPLDWSWEDEGAGCVLMVGGTSRVGWIAFASSQRLENGVRHVSSDESRRDYRISMVFFSIIGRD